MKPLPLQHAKLLLELSQNFYSNAVLNVSRLYDEDHSMAFVTTFEEFLKQKAFLRIDDSEADEAFESHVLLRVVKTLFEGQARKLPAI